VSAPIPLTNAVTSGDKSAVGTLLANGANVNERTSGGQTPLILAVIFGHTELVRVLVKAGADPELRDNLGLNAIEWAKRRGLTEALEILTNKPETNPRPRPTLVKTETEREETPAVTPEPTKREKPPEDERSRRWLAGLRQRLDEQELRRLNRNEPPPKARQVEEEPPTMMTVSSNEKPVTVTINTTETAPPEPVQPEPVKEAHPAKVFEPPASTASETGKRKRCPKCNAIYNSDLVSYCAHHIVALVDADEPILTEPPRKNPPLFWVMVIITLTGSIVVGSLVTTYLYKSNMAAQRSAAQQTTVQKGSPELSQELTGKEVLLPEAQCPVNGPEPVSGTVVVRVMVDKNGQVYWARGSGGDWLMRGAATDAAMKSTFAPEKLRGRETEGTITYTFKP
jgi:Ankyrin repeats (many copies)